MTFKSSQPIPFGQSLSKSSLTLRQAQGERLSSFKVMLVAVAVSASFAAFAQYNPNIQQNFQPQQNGAFQDWQNGASGANGFSGAAAAASATAAATFQNPAAQFLQSAAPASGYTKDGTLMMGGQKIGNPHQILHDAEVPSLIGITAVRYSFTDVPSYGQGTLAQIQTDMANAPISSDPTRLFSRLYLTATNPYTQGVATPHNNYQTYQGVVADAQAGSYQLTVADDNKLYAFKTLSAPNQQAMNILIKELPNTSQFKGSTDLKGGATGVHVTQSGDAAALQNYLATVKPYDFSWQSAFGPYAAMANYGGPVVFGANGDVNGINPYVDPASFYFNWVMGSSQVQSFQNQLNQESKQSGNESFGQLAWDSNTNQYVMLSASNQTATAGSVSGTMPSLGAGQTGVFGMHTHPDGSQPSNQDLMQASQLGTDQVIVGPNGMNYVVVPGTQGIGGGEFKFENGYLGGRGIRTSSTGNGASSGPQHGYVVIGARYIGDPNALIVSYGRDENGNLTRASSSSDLNQNDRKDWLNKDGNFNLLVDKNGNPISDEKLAKSADDLTNYLNTIPVNYALGGPNSNSAATSTAANAGANNPSIPGIAPGSGVPLPPSPPVNYPSVDAMGVPTGGTTTY